MGEDPSRGKTAKIVRSECSHMRISFLAWLALRSRGPPRVESPKTVVAAAGDPDEWGSSTRARARRLYPVAASGSSA